jgi:hypothetical protein
MNQIQHGGSTPMKRLGRERKRSIFGRIKERK